MNNQGISLAIARSISIDFKLLTNYPDKTYLKNSWNRSTLPGKPWRIITNYKSDDKFPPWKFLCRLH